MTIFISMWAATLYLYYLPLDSFYILFWGKLNFSSSVFIIMLLLLFIYYFPRVDSNLKKLINVIYTFSFFSVGTIALIQFTDLIIKAEIVVGSGRETIFGSLAILYYLSLGLGTLLILYIFIKKLASNKGQSRQQLKFLALGTLTTIFLAVISNLILPIAFGYYGTVIFGPLLTVIFVGFTTYAIVKHRMMDIRMVVARSISYSLLLLILAGIYAGGIFVAQTFIFPEASYSIGQVAVQAILALIMAFSFQPLRRWLTRITDRIFFKDQYNMNELLDQMAHTVGSTIILIEMMYKTMKLMTEEMKITRGMMVVFSDTGSILSSQSVGYKKSPKLESKDMQAMVKDGTLVLDELLDNSKYKKLLIKYEASVCVPIKNEGGVEGLILLGEKQSGDMYSQNDLKVFEIVMPEIAVAIANAKSYEKIEKFTITLRQEVKKATSELQKKNEQLRELDKAKDEFISMASHQLRTPLTAIKGYLSMLLEGDAGEIKVSQYDFVNEAFQGANRMVGLINDLLNVSRMETGRFFLEPSEVDLGKVVEEEVKQVSKQAKEKGLKLEIKIGKNIPKVWVDETKIRQVIMNFADNAVYYTTKGNVTVSLEADKSNVVYKVVDTGIGVPKNQQRNLFQKFYRADNARHMRPDGTGLGIYLAKRVMDDHGGELIFHSVEGKGSTFGFKIPKNTKLKIKKVSAPEPKTHTTKPEIGEIAAGIGISPEILEATQADENDKPQEKSEKVKNSKK